MYFISDLSLFKTIQTMIVAKRGNPPNILIYPKSAITNLLVKLL